MGEQRESPMKLIRQRHRADVQCDRLELPAFSHSGCQGLLITNDPHGAPPDSTFRYSVESRGSVRGPWGSWTCKQAKRKGLYLL